MSRLRYEIGKILIDCERIHLPGGKWLDREEALERIMKTITEERAKDYPEIEKIFIDIDRYIHRSKLKEIVIEDKKILKINPFTDTYWKGYRQCFKDLQNRIIGLIKKNKEVQGHEEG